MLLRDNRPLHSNKICSSILLSERGRDYHLNIRKKHSYASLSSFVITKPVVDSSHAF